MTKTGFVVATLAGLVALEGQALAQPNSDPALDAAQPSATLGQAPPVADSPSPQTAPKPAAAPAAPYSLPFQLRPAGPPPNVVRVDTVVAPYANSATQSGTATVSMVSGGLKIGDKFGVVTRAGILNHTSTDATTRQAFLNPVLTGVYGTRIAKDFRLSLYAGTALPFGAGGGNTPDKDTKSALGAASLARSAMDGTMFATNDLAIVPGVDLAYTKYGLTVQVEATAAQLLRMRGEQAQTDAARTNFLSGVHVGYHFLPFLAAGVEGRYQRWLSTPAAVEKDSSNRDNLTAAAGLRATVPIRGTMKALPGVSYAMGFRGPVGDRDYRIVQIDIPVVF